MPIQKSDIPAANRRYKLLIEDELIEKDILKFAEGQCKKRILENKGTQYVSLVCYDCTGEISEEVVVIGPLENVHRMKPLIAWGMQE